MAPERGDGAIDAGEFTTWRFAMQRAWRAEIDADVPCAGCTACCTASQFVHVDPDELDTLAHIPAALLFPAPGRRDGTLVMGHDEHGACPMLVDGACSIYEHRPRACRTYDCRVFAAAGIDPIEDGKAGVADRVRRWRFTYSDDDAAHEHNAVRRAAAFLHEHPECTRSQTALATGPRALLALELAALFVDDPAPSVDAVRRAVDDARERS